MSLAVDDDDTVVDALENRQYVDVGIRQALLQLMAFYGMRKNRVLIANRNVIHADIGIGTGSNSGDAAMLVFFVGQCHNREVAQ